MYIQTKRGSLWVDISGDGTPLVLLHGFTGSTETWKRLKPYLPSTLKTIAIDLPGHGKTTYESTYRMEDICDDVKYVIEALGYHKVHILGYSMGGRIALSFACTYPQYLKTVTLESTSPGLKTDHERTIRQESDEKLAKKLEIEGIHPFVTYWENIPLFQSQRSLPKSVQQEIKDERLGQNPNELAHSLRNIGTGSQPSYWDCLLQLDTPTLLITGELDEKFVKINSLMKKSLQNVHFRVISKTGHTIHVEKPQIFGKIVSDFILHNENMDNNF
ncbi:2-succinyl-6-hydroxy-2,4-cyclohexadiene-1-carboxylate synthase [Salirhabdus salicampi]|uniref:2-succinyl-6-hydroxy-2, 4-cyclohexadiene-1-carboxylate synthase n=1 Tax=Salirhabdus salicampi TaxID=476102 RepID=UPI0020C4B5BC|nr:2-succinyl-6-hydroxy-2,4-cyclohexadiene-1-carboxylate synthase [Salirhabdus salicampi]MCP8617788.1 2-succinyl-6-hydroxy-2,4-cyclohexadiene-1-carboxylate synthase [Salirhabdus salicampi]